MPSPSLEQRLTSSLGFGGKDLLDTFSVERQPVGLDVVTQANASLRNHFKIWEVLGNMEQTVEARVRANDELSADSPEGRIRRGKLAAALKMINREEHGLGIEMNQRYDSTAVYRADQGETPTFPTDSLENYHPTTYPGARVPHVWLSTAIPSKPVSTIDLAGKGRFALLTGIGGSKWKDAAKAISEELKIPMVAYSIGYGQDCEDMYLDWSKIRNVDESGCVLVRPDYFVAWRCQKWEDGGAEKLREVMKSVLSLK